MKDRKKTLKRTLISLLFLLLNVAIICYLAATDNEMKGDISGLSLFNFNIVIIAVVFMIVYIIIDIIKSYILIKFYTGKRMPLLSIKASLLGKYYDGITPFSAGSQPFQIYILNKHNINGIHASGIVLIKFFIFQLVFFIFGVLCLVVTAITRTSYGIGYHILFIVSLAINLIVPCMFYYLSTHGNITGKLLNFFLNIGKKLHLIKNKDEFNQRVHDRANRFAIAFIQLKAHKIKVLKIFILTFVEVALYILIPFILYISYNPGILTSPELIKTIIKFSSAYLFIYFVISIIPIPGGSGAAEFGFKWLMETYFVTNMVSSVSIAIILWRSITYYFPIIIGVFIMVGDFLLNFRKSKSHYHNNSKN